VGSPHRADEPVTPGQAAQAAYEASIAKPANAERAALLAHIAADLYARTLYLERNSL
jgi:hypothetical protein